MNFHVRYFLLIILTTFVLSCTQSQGCQTQSTSTTAKISIERNQIQYNALQVQINKRGFNFLEQELIPMIQQALGQTFTFNIPEFVLYQYEDPVTHQKQGYAICDKAHHPQGCTANIIINPNSLKINSINNTNESDNHVQLDITLQAQIIAPQLAYIATSSNTNKEEQTKDCAIDLQYRNHFDDVCIDTSTPRLSWEDFKNRSDFATEEDKQKAFANTFKACQNYCQNQEATHNTQDRSIGVHVQISLDSQFKYPKIKLEQVDLTLDGESQCPASADIVVYQPNRQVCPKDDLNCKEKYYRQTLLEKAPMVCGLIQPLYDVIKTKALQNLLKDLAIYAVNQQITQLFMVPCEADNAQSVCPQGSFCQTTNITQGWPKACQNNINECLIKPAQAKVCVSKNNNFTDIVQRLIGIEGLQDLTQLQTLYQPLTKSPLHFIAGVGGHISAPAMQTQGLYVSGFVGMQNERSFCVPRQEPPAFLPSAPLIQQIGQDGLLDDHNIRLFSSRTNGFIDKPYSVAISLSVEALNKMAYELHQSGALCLNFSNTDSFSLNSNLLSLIMPSLDTLSGNQNTPAFLSIAAAKAPTFSVGEGTLSNQDNKISIDSPHLEMNFKELHLDVYAMIDSRYVRVMNIIVDFNVGVYLDFKEDGTLLPITNAPQNWIRRIQINHVEILAESQETLQKNIPQLLDFALPFVSKSLLQSFPLPQFSLFNTYALKIAGLRGQQRKMNLDPSLQPRFDYLSVFFDIQKTSQTRTLNTVTPLIDTDKALSSQLQFIPSNNTQTLLKINPNKLITDKNTRVYYSYQLDNGFFTPFEENQNLVINRPSLSIPGPHQIKVIEKTIHHDLLDATYVSGSMNILVPNTQNTGKVVHVKTSGCNGTNTNNLWFYLLLLVFVWVLKKSGPYSIRALLSLGLCCLFLNCKKQNPSGFESLQTPVCNQSVQCGQDSAFRFGQCVRARCEVDNNNTDCCPGQYCNFEGTCTNKIKTCQTDKDCMGGQFCINSAKADHKTCQFKRPSSKKLCEEGLFLFNDHCIQTTPCNASCPDDKVCNIKTNECEPIPHNAQTSCTQSCAPGSLKVYQATDSMIYDNCCAASCSCEPLPPIELGQYGTDVSSVVSDNDILVTSYNETYGDLMLTHYDKNTGYLRAVEFIDGLPTQEIGIKNTLRKGLKTAGPNVGKHTQILIGSDKKSRIIYYDVDQKDLKYAQETDEGYQIHTVDAPGQVGQYASFIQSGGKLRIAYYVEDAPALNRAIPDTVDGIRYAESKTNNINPLSAKDWDFYDVDVLPHHKTKEDKNPAVGKLSSISMKQQGDQILIAYQDKRLGITASGDISEKRANTLKLAFSNLIQSSASLGFNVITLDKGEVCDTSDPYVMSKKYVVGNDIALAVSPLGNRIGIAYTEQDNQLSRVKFFTFKQASAKLADQGCPSQEKNLYLNVIDDGVIDICRSDTPTCIQHMGASIKLWFNAQEQALAIYQEQSTQSLRLAQEIGTTWLSKNPWKAQNISEQNHEPEGFYIDVATQSLNRWFVYSRLWFDSNATLHKDIAVKPMKY